MALSDFLNSYTSISPYSLFFSLFFLCSHYVHVVQKTLRVGQKTVVLTKKKNFYIEVTLRAKIMCHKEICSDTQQRNSS